MFAKRHALILLMFMILFSNIHINTAQTTSVTQPTLIVDQYGQYRLEIIAFYFNYTLVDLNKVDSLVAGGMNYTQAMNESSYYHALYNLDLGRIIQITAKSREGTHGLAINELSVDFLLVAPSAGQTYGASMNRTASLPSVDATLDAQCNHYCGAGHGEMTFQLIVGAGNDFATNVFNPLTDWRVYVLFGLFALGTFVVLMIAVMKPLNFKRDNSE